MYNVHSLGTACNSDEDPAFARKENKVLREPRRSRCGPPSQPALRTQTPLALSSSPSSACFSWWQNAFWGEPSSLALALALVLELELAPPSMERLASRRRSGRGCRSVQRRKTGLERRSRAAPPPQGLRRSVLRRKSRAAHRPPGP